MISTLCSLLMFNGVIWFWVSLRERLLCELMFMSLLIILSLWRYNQWTGFYVMGNSDMEESKANFSSCLPFIARGWQYHSKHSLDISKVSILKTNTFVITHIDKYVLSAILILSKLLSKFVYRSFNRLYKSNSQLLRIK